MQSLSCSRSLCLVLILCLCMGASCNQSTPVTSNGVPVTNEAIATAGRVAKTADLALAAAVKTLTAGITAGVIPREVGQRYETEIAPKVQATLDGLRTLLQQQNAHPGQVTAEQLAEAMRLVLAAVTEVQEFVAQASPQTPR